MQGHTNFSDTLLNLFISFILVEIVHWTNATFGVTAELVEESSSPFGRWPHHLIDGICHSILFTMIGISYRGSVPEWWKIAVSLSFGLLFDQLPVGGQSFDLKFNAPELWARKESLAATLFTFDNNRHVGIGVPSEVLTSAVYWGYAARILVSIAIVATPSQILLNWRSFCPQLLFYVLFVFNPAAEMLFAGSKVNATRSYYMHFAHGASMLAWNAPVWLWTFGLKMPRAHQQKRA